MAKYVFVTGGVVSSLGKGITAASLGCLLKSYGLKVNILKMDPYLNVDPGTMSPYQHGEVYVTDDGAETDLDLGHYERFMDENMSKLNNITSGSIYNAIITRERRGDYLGGTVQVVPHVVDEIKSRIKMLGPGYDVVIVELGGTTGDIEGLPFLEAIRQFRFDVGRENVSYVHVTLVPYIRAAQELKTKPTQQSVAKLREIGIEPNFLICRTEREITEEMKDKMAMFCNVRPEAVIEERDVQTSIYEVPSQFEKCGFGKLIMKDLGLKKKNSRPHGLDEYVKNLSTPKETVTIGVAGKYTQLKDAYKSIWDALIHAGAANHAKINIQYIDVEDECLCAQLEKVDGILIPGGFGGRGSEGKISTVQYARENKVPFLGLCLGLQIATIEFARNVCGMKGANTTEFNLKTKYPVIDLLPEQRKVRNMGATMRLGAYPCKLKKGTLAHKAYGKDLISERHRHRYEMNNKFRAKLVKNGLVISGANTKLDLTEIIELKDHPFFIASQFHPEFKSRPVRPHPLFREFVKAVMKQAHEKRNVNLLQK